MRDFLSFLTLRARVVGTTAFFVAVLGGAGCGSKSEDSHSNEPDTDSGPVGRDLDASVAVDSGKKPTASSARDGGLSDIKVGADSLACSANLSFHPKGCLCNAGASASCFTGPANRRNANGCHDGVQECVNQGEFAEWGACQGEVRDCADPPTDAGVPGECACKPGAKILCSEDCSQLIICSLTGTKTCGPDGRWGPCREEFLAGLENVSLCKSLYFGCLPGQDDGIYVGACDDSFTCGHVPGVPPILVPGEQTPTPDAGRADAGSTPSVQ